MLHKKETVWAAMFNLDHEPKTNVVTVLGAYIMGWLCNLFLFDIKTFSVEFFVKGGGGVLLAVCSAVAVKYTNKYLDSHFENKKLKSKHNAKRKSKSMDDEQAA